MVLLNNTSERLVLRQNLVIKFELEKVLTILVLLLSHAQVNIDPNEEIVYF